MSSLLIKNATIVNEGLLLTGDVFVRNGRIEKIAPEINKPASKEINAEGKHLFPGCIDDQVHFREPGLTHKGTIASESAAAIAGGITSYMDMPNTVPPTLTQELLEEKYRIAAKTSFGNYSFYMGTSHDNLEEVMKTNPKTVCGIKVFMGSSTGNMLINDESALSRIFEKAPTLVAAHCEDEVLTQINMERYTLRYGKNIRPEMHPLIRTAQSCFGTANKAILLARQYHTRLHVLHLSTGTEPTLFDNKTPLKDKQITAEVCIHHLWFTDADYHTKGNFIKWNPAIKTALDRAKLLAALLDDHIDIIATDHAPHTIEEKSRIYIEAPSGGPLVQHSLPAVLEFYHQDKLTLDKIVEKMSHNPAICFKIQDRGFIREGYRADIVLVDINHKWTVDKANVLYKCGWSPFNGHVFKSKVCDTIVNGCHIFQNGKFIGGRNAQRLTFDR